MENYIIHVFYHVDANPITPFGKPALSQIHIATPTLRTLLIPIST